MTRGIGLISIIWALIFGVVITVNSNTALALSEEKIKEDISDYRKQEEEIRLELKNQESELFEYSEEIATLEEEIHELKEKLSGHKAALIKTRDDLKDQKIRMEERIKYTYENPKRGSDIVTFILMLMDGRHSGSKEYTGEILAYDRKQIAEYEKRKTKLFYETKDYIDQKKLYKKKKADLEEKKAKLLEEISENEKNIENITEKREERERELAGLINKMRQVEAFNYTKTGGISLEEKYAKAAEMEGSSGRPVTPAVGEEELLAAIIYCEAGGEPYEGQLAVGSVVLNRVNNSRFPNSITDVIYAPKQFSPVGSGRLALVLAKGLTNESSKRAARDVLSGTITGNWLYFRVNNGTRSGTVIGKQVFY